MSAVPVDRFPINGIDGASGEYLLPPLDPQAAVALARSDPTDRVLVRWLREVAVRREKPRLGLPAGVEPEDVAKAGWGVVFHERESADVRTALAPLIEHRRATVGARVKELDYRTGEQWRQWLVRHEVAPGTIDPGKVPYYLLLVGDPTGIPYRFQYLLDVEYAVGRVAFDDPRTYRHYAASVVDHETAEQPSHGRTAAFFGTRHDGDGATQLSADHLVTPLADGADGRPSAAQEAGWMTEKRLAATATRDDLKALLRGDARGRPHGVCFTAGHGIGFRRTDGRQRELQGALVCQDWTGPGRIARDDYLGAADVPDDARVHGMVMFVFACFGAGTPERDDFVPDESGGPRQIADRPFVARLPQALLSHPNGGALAVIGHVERAWGCSFLPLGARPQLQPFRNSLAYLMAGQPVAHALRDIRDLYRGLSTELSDVLDEMRFGGDHPDAEVSAMWLARNDARNYTVLGDPAVRLRG